MRLFLFHDIILYRTAPIDMDRMLFYEILVFLLAIFIFNSLEELRPGHPVQKRKYLYLNILALLIVIFGGEYWRVLIAKGFLALGTAEHFSLSAIKNLPSAPKIILGVIVTDFALYWVHRCMHESDILWYTHKFHHSIDDLWWLSGARTSLSHLFLFALPQTFLVKFIFVLNPLEATIAGGISIIVNLWVHTNIWVNLGPLEWLFITPNYHRVHHGQEKLSRSNLAFVLTIWDRMFGTHIDPRQVGKGFPLGFVPTKKRLFRLIIGY